MNFLAMPVISYRFLCYAKNKKRTLQAIWIPRQQALYREIYQAFVGGEKIAMTQPEKPTSRNRKYYSLGE